MTAVLAWQVPFLSFPGAFDRDELEEVYKNYLIETVSGITPNPAVPLETLVAEGDPTESLVEASKARRPAGARHPGPDTRFRGLLLGGVSQGAAATAHCPVVLVKVTDQD